MKILLDNEVPIQQWEIQYKASSYASPFQSFGYYTFIKANKDFSANVFACVESDSITALCVVTLQKEKGVKGYFSRRAIIYGGILLSEIATEQTIDLLIKKITEYYRNKAIYIEFRNYFDYSRYSKIFTSNSWKYEPYLNFQLYLNGIDKNNVLKLFSYNRRREIKLSISEGATYYLCQNKNDIEQLYNILNELYKEKVKLPLPDLQYFIGLYKNEMAKFFVVKHDNRIIGGSICLHVENKSIYTYYYCGIRKYSKKVYPTHLAVLAAVEYAINNKLLYVDFMGAGKPNSKYGVRDYKSQFGGTLVEFGRYRKILNPFLFRIGELGIKILSRL